MDISIIEIFAFIGLVLSIYFLYVKLKARHKGYNPLCDISSGISCSRAANSKFSNLFFFPNAAYGIILYLFIIFFANNFINLTFYLTLILSLVSVYLLFELYRSRNFCVVCVIIHIINFILLYFSYFNL